MALIFEKFTKVLPTTTQSVAVTGLAKFTTQAPKAVILWTSGQTATGFGATARMSFGFAASPTQRGAVAIRGADAATGTGRNTSITRCLLPSITTAGVIEMELDLTSFDVGGLTLALTVTSAGTAYVIHGVALGGSDLANIFSGSNTPSAGTGNKGRTGVGFRPGLVIIAEVNDPVGGGSDTGASIGIAAFTANQNGATHFRSRNAANPTQDANYQRSDRAYLAYQTGSDAVDHEASVVTMDADGYTLNHSVRADATVGYIDLCFGGGRYDVRAETQKTSTGTKATTGLGFVPTGLLGFGANAVANASPILTQAKISIGASDGTTEGSSWCASTDNVATADRNSSHSDTKFLQHASNTATLDAECDASFNFDGYTLDWTTADATAREFIGVAFGSKSDTITSERRTPRRRVLQRT